MLGKPLNDVKDIKNVLSVILSSIPSDFGEFIKWVAEVRRREEDGGQSLSQEEKGRLAVKEETKVDNLPDIAARVCCQGAVFFVRVLLSGSSNGFCCRETCVNCFKVNGESTVVDYCWSHDLGCGGSTCCLSSKP
ncbi:Glutathione gamma-glutamylcysteinyltransferase 1 [Camellia lanceoleosa]|uniref:Glutathione gamma-glutamylcysteinyltransferase 1 n=1 Tax=Camellia lanceoleosa TaxID=1840588 RepID=A0ACC0HY73_9ERIC|nr:Glutathione gamma-glutamylcysteinyltransferase 1 [Camellia lanceoleosa]